MITHPDELIEGESYRITFDNGGLLQKANGSFKGMMIKDNKLVVTFNVSKGTLNLPWRTLTNIRAI